MPTAIDKTALTLPEATNPRTAMSSGVLARKVSDEFAVSLCRGHPREVHRHGVEAKWRSNTGIQMMMRPIPRPTEIRRCFLGLTTLDKGASERQSRYETALWRQIGQFLYILKFI